MVSEWTCLRFVTVHPVPDEIHFKNFHVLPRCGGLRRSAIAAITPDGVQQLDGCKGIRAALGRVEHRDQDGGEELESLFGGSGSRPKELDSCRDFPRGSGATSTDRRRLGPSCVWGGHMVGGVTFSSQACVCTGCLWCPIRVSRYSISDRDVASRLSAFSFAGLYSRDRVLWTRPR